MKAEQLEKIVKANFAVERKWSTRKNLDLGGDYMACLFLYFGLKYFKLEDMAKFMSISKLNAERLIISFNDRLKSDRFKVKFKLIENKIRLEYENV